MSEPQTLGDFIRERRLALGFSAGQLAMRLHSTAAVVRTWERGHEPIPEDALPGLAELLVVDEADLRALQPTAPPVEAVAAEAPSEEAGPTVAEARSEPAPAAVAPVEADATEDTPIDEPEEQPERSPNGSGDAGVVGHTPGLAVDTGLLEAPTEAIEPVRPRAGATGGAAATGTRVRPAPRSAAAARPPLIAETPAVEPAAVLVDGTVPDWLGPVRVLFDPSKRYLYWARWVGTAVGLYILLRVLGFAVDGLLEAIGDFWDSFSTPEPAGVADEAGIDALAVLSSR